MLISNFVFSQNVETMKNLDTIYFKYTGNEEFVKKVERNNEINVNYKIYRIKYYNILFIYPSSKIDTISSENFINTQYVNNFFLNRNKSKIIDVEFFNNFKSCLDCNSFVYSLKKRVFYVIDITEKKKGKIPIYRVNPIMNCPSVE